VKYQIQQEAQSGKLSLCGGCKYLHYVEFADSQSEQSATLAMERLKKDASFNFR